MFLYVLNPCYLTLWPSKSYLKSFDLCATAHMSIISLWKSPSPPTLNIWFQKIGELLVMEKILDALSPSDSDSYRSFYANIWFPVISFIVQNPTLFEQSHYIDV